MPAKSEKQRRLFAIAEHHPEQLYKANRHLADLPQKTLHEFAHTRGAGGGGGSPVKFRKREGGLGDV